MEQKGIITIQLTDRGDLIYIDLDGTKLREPTHNLYAKVPPGVLKGTIDIGEIYTYEQADGTLSRCVHRGICNIY
jgi:hypothetical protein